MCSIGVLFLILIDQDPSDRLRGFLAVAVEPFPDDGGDAGGEKFDVIVDMTGVGHELRSDVGRSVFQKQFFEVEAELEIELIEDLILFDIFKELKKIETVFTVFRFFGKDIQKLLHHPFKDGSVEFFDAVIVGIESRTVDMCFLADIGNGDRSYVVS